MLSIANVASSADAANYYEVDDYYTGGQAYGLWFGDAATALDLEGSVDPEIFRQILVGSLPNGQHIHNAGLGHRGGVDLTFSAPKSVSMQALVAGDHRIIEAHQRAVARCLNHAEQLAQCRVTAAGETSTHRTANLIGAAFIHSTSRACDPQLHTHNVILNATMREDGTWRALDNEPLYRAKMLLGAAYRSELAASLQALGYEIRLTHSDGRFELKGYDAKILKAFSQRADAIERHLAERHDGAGHASPLERKVAALATREKKRDIDAVELRELWHERLEELGGRLIDIPTASTALGQEALREAADTAIQRAVLHLAEREAVFTRQAVCSAALGFGTGETLLTNVLERLAQWELDGRIVAAGEFLTTAQAISMESNLLQRESAEREQLLPPACPQAGLAMRHGISDEQALAVASIVATTSRAIGVVGKAGTGKTTMLKAAVSELEVADLPVFGLAPSASAARELAKARLTTFTVAAFLNSEPNPKMRGGVLLVDEAGMLSTAQMDRIFRRAIQLDMRLVLVGDPKQLSAVEAGKPFEQMLRNGMPVALLGTIRRQNDIQLRRSVELASEGEVERAIRAIEDSIVEIPDRVSRTERIALEYASLSEADRRGTLIVSGTRAGRSRINDAVRCELGLSGTSVSTNTLHRRDFTAQQAASVVSYSLGDVVVAERDYRSLGLRRGEQSTVVAVGATAVTLQRADGLRTDWRPTLARDLTAYEVVEREVATHDLLRVGANLHRHGLINGDLLKVLDVDSNARTFTVECNDGRHLALSLDDRLPIDHGYCWTVHASQGQTCDRVIVDAESASMTANAASFYVAISRAREQAMIFTDDRDLLPRAMSRSAAKSSAMEMAL